MKHISDVLATEDTSPQLIEGMALCDYLALPHLSGSPIGAPSMKHLRCRYETEQPITDAMRLGSAADCLVFDCMVPAVRTGRSLHDAIAEFDEAWPVFGGTRRGAKWDEFSAEHGDAYFRSYDERQNVVEMSRHIITDAVAAPYWQEGVSQSTLLTVERGVRLKHRPDWIASDSAIVDMKTTADATRCSSTVRSFAYHTKMALYRLAVQRITGRQLPCVLIFVEQKPPYDVVVMPIDEATLSLREEQALKTIAKLRQCIEDDHWPGLANGEELPYEPTMQEMDEFAFEEVD